MKLSEIKFFQDISGVFQEDRLGCRGLVAQDDGGLLMSKAKFESSFVFIFE